MEDVFQSLKKKHEGEYSGPQLRLWARMVVAKTHDDLDNPPKVPMMTGSIQKQPHRESLTDAFTSAATAIAKAFSPPPIQSNHSDTMLRPDCVRCSPSKATDIRMKNLEQL